MNKHLIKTLINNKEISIAKKMNITYWYNTDFNKGRNYYCWKKDWDRISSKLFVLFYVE